MVTLDRIRLTGLLREKPWKQGFFYFPPRLNVYSGTSSRRTASRLSPAASSCARSRAVLGAGSGPDACTTTRVDDGSTWSTCQPAGLAQPSATFSTFEALRVSSVSEREAAASGIAITSVKIRTSAADRRR